ncbi:MAG: hypothetical protein A2W23_04135 [Planctomycetes bacterium RBG_16_43_13]|nr:MAG: hypothetical protein A2W23_04135 [Planctomycetes bacterium RBG_16_43_13]
MKTLSIVLPCYNEETNIESAINRIYGYLSNIGYAFEIITVDDGSTDGTAHLIEEISRKIKEIRMIHYVANRGKGYAVRIGMLSAIFDKVLFLDCDMAVPIEELDKFIPYIEKGYDIVVGSKRLAGSELIKKESPLREFLGRGFVSVSNLILGTRATDITRGFKLFKRNIAREIFSRQRLERWGFDAEILFIAQKRGYKIKEVPVSFSHGRNSKVNVARDILYSLWELLIIRYNDLKGVYS